MNYTQINLFVTVCFGIAVIAFVFAIFAIPILVSSKMSGDIANRPWIRIGIGTAVVLITMYAFLSLKSKANQYLVDCVSSGYSVYYNGEAIDGTKVNFNDYSVSIDEEKEEIYLANKPVRTRRHVVSIVYPR